MNIPQIVAITLNRLKSEPHFVAIALSIQEKLEKISNPLKRAALVHKEVDQEMKVLLKDETVQKFLACKKGCSFCCHTQVSATSDEARLLSDYVISGKVQIDLERLKVQAEKGTSHSAWYTLKYEDRKCVFLNSNNECTAYEVRPSVCRTNNVLLTSENCDTRDGQIRPQRLLNTDRANMVIAGDYLRSKRSGTLPEMLLFWLKELGHVKKNESQNDL
jgi:Fe-S-cluster containining protein